MRTTYGKKLKKKRSIPSGSAAVADEQWPYFSQMSFLDQYIKHRNTVDNLVDVNEEPDQEFVDVVGSAFAPDHDTDVDTPATQPTSSSTSEADSTPESYGKRRKKDNNNDRAKEELVRFLKKSTERAETLKEADKYHHFGSLVAAHLRSKPPGEADLYMRKISGILFSHITLVQVEVEQDEI